MGFPVSLAFTEEALPLLFALTPTRPPTRKPSARKGKEASSGAPVVKIASLASPLASGGTATGAADAIDDTEEAEALLAAEPWLKKLLDAETAAARAELPAGSIEHAAQGWVLGRTKVFMRGFLFAYLGRQCEQRRSNAVRRLQVRARRKHGKRGAATNQLQALVTGGTVEQLRRILPRAKAAGATKDMAREAERTLRALTVGAELRVQSAPTRHAPPRSV